MGTVIGKLDRNYNSIAVGDTIGIEVDGVTVRYTVDSFGGIVKEDGTRLAPKEWKGEASRILETGEKKPEFPQEDPDVVTDLREPVELPPLEPLPSDEMLETVPPAGVSDMEDEAREVMEQQKEERLAAMEGALETLRQELSALRTTVAAFAMRQNTLAGDVEDALCAVEALRSDAVRTEEPETGRILETCSEEELTNELQRRGYRGTVSKVMRMDD